MLRNRSWYLFILVLLIVTRLSASANAEDAAGKFSPEAWRLAALSSKSDWSREDMVEEFAATNKITEMSREQVLSLLGPPGYGAESFSFGSGFARHVDMYRLSAKNDRLYLVEYDASGKAVSGVVEGGICSCELCSAEAPIVEKTNLRKALSKDEVAHNESGVKVSGFEAIVGETGKRSSTMSPAGGQLWAHYADVWQIAEDAHTFFLIDGARPARDWKMNDFGDSVVYSYTFITFTPDCL